MVLIWLLLIAALFLTGCDSHPAKPVIMVEESSQPWYSETIAKLQVINLQAANLVKAGKPDPAAELIQQGEAIIPRLLSVPHPTFAAMEAASELDNLYGRMFLTNRHWGWARLMFQKNLARWKNWRPQTEDTVRRLREAQDLIAECDRHIE